MLLLSLTHIAHTAVLNIFRHITYIMTIHTHQFDSLYYRGHDHDAFSCPMVPPHCAMFHHQHLLDYYCFKWTKPHLLSGPLELCL
jgi:hypothetical protein